MTPKKIIVSPITALFYPNHGYKKARRPVYMSIEIEEKENEKVLSISGVESPTLSGDCYGSAGQIYKPLSEYEEPVFNQGWDEQKYNKFIETWERWHLNDMNPSCEHQRQTGYKEKAKTEVTLYTHKLKLEFSQQQEELKENLLSQLASGATLSLGNDDKIILSLNYSIKTHLENLPEPIAKFYRDEKETETKTLGWLNETEHPEGLLSKPCPTCGYKYGSAWLYETLPEDVETFLFSLPQVETIPQWYK